jgi:competence protein ComEA
MTISTRFLSTLLLLPPATFAASQDDAGQALLQRTCTSCHSLDGIQRRHNSKERWSEIVDDMVSRGAEATDSELNQIVAYLARTQGKRLNINKASADELAGVLEIPSADAAAIVTYREKNGNFKSMEDVSKVPGIDAKTLEGKKDRLDFTDAR